MVKPAKTSTLKKELDRLHSLYIRRGLPRCVVCGSAMSIQCGHLFSRVSLATRWDVHEGGNCFPNCAGCNIKHEYDPYPMNNWYIQKFGKDAWDKLYARWHTVSPSLTKTFLRERIEWFKNELAL